jgi:Secretion system C-terminal sorting domain
MKARILFCLLTGILIICFPSISIASVPAGQDTIVIPGGTLAGGENAGLLEATINGDTTISGARTNPNRVYALNEGQTYFQNAAITVNNPTGTLTIVGIPSSHGTTKPVWLMEPVGGVPVSVSNNSAACNAIYGSAKFVNIHYQAIQLDGSFVNDNFWMGTKNHLPQSLTIDNCLFEFSNIDLFECSNSSGYGTGGWPYGAKFRITNSYFRNLFHGTQWWGSRIIHTLNPIDTLWVENTTITGGGLTFLTMRSLIDFGYFNHNTIVNNMKYWLFSPYYKELYVTNNIFINQNWVGEDTANVTKTGQDPDNEFFSTINIDTVDAYHAVLVQSKYYAGDSSHYTDAVSLKNMKVYVSNNINYSDPLLTPYYTNAGYAYDPAPATTPLSYLSWWYPSNPPYVIQNIPCEWMNARTQALFNAYAPGKGKASPGCGFVEENTSTANPNTITPGIADASVVTFMAKWNQNQWGDPHYSTAPNINGSKYIFGDYDPTTIPGYKTENGSGIAKFTDLTENFSQSTHLSEIDQLPIGSLIWNDAQLAAYNSADELTKVLTAYANATGGIYTPPVPTWRIQLIASIGAYQDAPNYAGIDSTASDGYDAANDIPKPPPPPGKYVSLYFPHPEWNSPFGNNFGSDIRQNTSLTDTVKLWNFQVKTNVVSDTVVLSFVNVGIPSTFGIYLIDISTGHTFNLRNSALFKYYNADSTAHLFTLMIGTLVDNFSSFSPAGWSLFSLPLTPVNSSPSSFFGDTSYVWSFNPSSGYDQPDALVIGKGYWLGLLSPKSWTLKGTPSEADSIIIPLNTGYSIIGNSYIKPVTKESMSIIHSGTEYSFADASSAGLIINAMYQYDSTGYADSDTLPVFGGRWIASLQNGVQLVQKPASVIPPPKNNRFVQQMAKSQAAVSTSYWNLAIQATNGVSTDKIFSLGVEPMSTNGFDAKYDAPRPPRNPGANYLELYTVHTGSNYPAFLGSRYAKDFRDSTGMTWTFTVESSKDSAVTLSWDKSNLAGLNQKIVLRDSSNGQIVDMSATNTYSFAYISPHTFMINGTITNVKPNNGILPAVFALLQNYPNPFNPSTKISYQLPKSSFVTLKVYDIIGKEVSTLVNEQKDAGEYEVTFDGSRLASGVYFYRMTAATFTAVKKFVLMK